MSAKQLAETIHQGTADVKSCCSSEVPVVSNTLSFTNLIGSSFVFSNDAPREQGTEVQDMLTSVAAHRAF